MTAPTLTRSAFPVPVGELLTRAVDMAVDAGEIPSRNRFMTELRIGAPRATAIRQALAASGTEWALSRELLTRPGAETYRAEWTTNLVSTLTPLAEHPDDPTADEAPEPHLKLVTDVEADPGTGTVNTPEVAPDPPAAVETVPEPSPLVAVVADPGTTTARPARPVRTWPVLLLALPAFVAIWSGWVGLGTLTGFGMVNLLPGIVAEGSWSTINTAITLPIGVETYAAFALRAWLSPNVPARARRFARMSAIASLLVGAAGQVAYHLMTAAGQHEAHWTITTAVASLPVAVLGMGAALAHLMREHEEER